MLEDKGAKGFTTNFDDLGDANVEQTGLGFDQIPGLASQRMMAEGYGFGAEGDWKSAALYRSVWVMNQGLQGGCSFLEDYTLNFNGEQSAILQSHMLEVCIWFVPVGILYFPRGNGELWNLHPCKLLAT